MFNAVPNNVSFPKLEEAVIKLWREKQVYEKSLDLRQDAESFVFFEGPPTANGLPHPGHCLTRAIKDLYPRYKTMRGYRCDRKAGWDTHGLPVEVEVCKELGIHSKEEIETYGVEPFIHRCIESVFRYTKEWEHLTERLGFWIHMDEAYVTFHKSYVESVWWSLANLFNRGLLYQGHKIVWWWAQGGTALSAGEVGQGYREVADPSVFVRFPLVETLDGETAGCDLLVWTTTPWTLPSNQFAAVKPGLEYSLVEVRELPAKGSDEPGELDPRRLVIASALVDSIGAKAKKHFTVVETFTGDHLVGRRYTPPFHGYYNSPGRDGKTLGETVGELRDGGEQHIAWRVVAANFVTTDSGSGLVHQAPAFGEIDYEVLAEQRDRFVDGQGPELICCVAPDGKFFNESHGGDEYQHAPQFVRGMWVKDADKPLSKDLRERGLLLLLDQYLHDYPFCWRADSDPLIQYPRHSWFVKTTQFKDQMLKNNQGINWLPEHIKDGRFGNFLESNVDWALSRERYWGTPLPIWVCEETGRQEAIGNYEELLAKPGVLGTDVWDKAKAANPELCDDLKVHKPYIDAVTYESPFSEGARMHRVPEVIDCWYDSGAMPFAQWGYPHKDGSDKKLASQFPADFISEAIDQTRGWFYSQLAISTLLFGGDDTDNNADGSTGNLPATAKALTEKVGTFLEEERPGVEFPHPFKNCIVLGLMLSEWFESPDGKQVFLTEEEAKAACGKKYSRKVGKMSKSKRNFSEPNQIFNKFGADALRWYFFANQTPWTSIRYSEPAIKESMPEFMLRLWNCYGFFVIYANIDGFEPEKQLSGELGQLTGVEMSKAETYRPLAERSELDRWVMSELNATCAAVVERMDAYDNYTACAKIIEFVDALSNWYVRRSRDRFWGSEQTPDKLDAYWTLYECLVTTTKLVAPFVPFLAEELWQNLVVSQFGDRVVESVHLCDFPTGDAAIVNRDLSEQMKLLREIVSMGLSARMNAKLKVRQPLSSVEVVLADATHQTWLKQQAGLICQELNVKSVEYAADADQYISYTVLPDLKRLGKKLGKQIPELKKSLAGVDGGQLLSEMEAAGSVTFDLPGGSVTLDSDDLQVRLQAKEGWAASQGKSCVVVIDTELTDELVAEGYAREMVRFVQDRRKEIGCEYTDRIRIGVVTDSDELTVAITEHSDYIQKETLAIDLAFEAVAGAEVVELKLAGMPLELYVKIEK